MALLPLSSLSDDETKAISDDVMERMRALSAQRELGPDEYYMVYAETLGDWGVMCPHPSDRRLYDGEKSFAESTEHRWFLCTMCKCAVVNPLYAGERKPFERRLRMFAPKLRKTPSRDDDGGGNDAA